MSTSLTEERIFEVARHAFEKKGYEGVRMQDIADEAGISKASLHYYFRSKDKLFERIFEDALKEFIPIISTFSDEALDWDEKVKTFTHKLFEFIRAGRMLFIIREVNRNPELLSGIMEKKKKKQNTVVRFFEVLAEENKIVNTDPRLLYLFLNSLCSFPVINREMFMRSLRMSNKEYDELLLNYAESAAGFFINAVKNK